MKTLSFWILAVVIVLGGMWMFWPKSSLAPEATQTPTPTGVGATQTPTPTPTPVKSVQPRKTATPTPTPSPTSVGVTVPNITSVTAYQTTTQPAGWWIRIVGNLPNPPQGMCYQLDSPSFSENDGAYYVMLESPHFAQASVCVLPFIQTLSLGASSLTPGMHTVYVNGHQWTSFIVPASTPTPTPSPLE
jgi:hypothetical protein